MSKSGLRISNRATGAEIWLFVVFGRDLIENRTSNLIKLKIRFRAEMADRKISLTNIGNWAGNEYNILQPVGEQGANKKRLAQLTEIRLLYTRYISIYTDILHNHQKNR